MKKLVSLLLAAVMLLSVTSFALADDVKEIDVMVWYRDIDDLNFAEMPYYNDPNTGITAQTGVHANFNQVKGSDWSTKLNLMLAAGEYPDIIQRGEINLEMYGVDQEILLPLDEYIDQYMPNYKAMLDADPELARSLRSSDGKMYQIGWIIPQNICLNSHLFINKTWLDNLGLEVPTTIEEYEQVLIAFRDGDADGDGDPSNEIPLGATWNSSVSSLKFYLSSWGIPFNLKYVGINDDNKVYSWLQDERLREAMETLSRWYQEGLIDVEAVTQDENAFEAKLNTGTYGSFWRWRMTAMGTDEAVYSQYVCMLPPTVEGVQAQLWRYLESPTFGAALTVGCKDIEAACRWMDAQFEWENMVNGYNDMKGEFWFVNDDGMTELLPMSDGTRSVPGQSSYYYCPGDLYFSKFVMPSHRIEKTTYCQEYEVAGVVEKNSQDILQKLVTKTVDESAQIDLLYAELSKYAGETLTGFVVKGVTDEGWDTYIKTLDSLRIDEYIGIYQAAYDRYLEINK
ncbi:MAG: extracellular solute-binding protein [Eubacteriales bacterium]|nr:extracellular solute-binding protein [Eubacteriales bacterium]